MWRPLNLSTVTRWPIQRVLHKMRQGIPVWFLIRSACDHQVNFNRVLKPPQSEIYTSLPSNSPSNYPAHHWLRLQPGCHRQMTSLRASFRRPPFLASPEVNKQTYRALVGLGRAGRSDWESDRAVRPGVRSSHHVVIETTRPNKLLWLILKTIQRLHCFIVGTSLQIYAFTIAFKFQFIYQSINKTNCHSLAK